MWMSMPVAVDRDTVWMFCQFDDSDRVEAGRLGFNPETNEFCAFAPEVFDTNSVLPVSRLTDVDHGYRWATTSDVRTHASRFTPPAGAVD